MDIDTPLSAQVDSSLRLLETQYRRRRELLEEARTVASLTEACTERAEWRLCLVRDDAGHTRVPLVDKKFADTEEPPVGPFAVLDVYPLLNKFVTLLLVPEDRATLVLRVRYDGSDFQEAWRAPVDLASLRRKKGSGTERLIRWHPEGQGDATGLALELRLGAEKGSLEIVRVLLREGFYADTPVARALRRYGELARQARDEIEFAVKLSPLAPPDGAAADMRAVRSDLEKLAGRAPKRARTREPEPAAAATGGEEEDGGFLLHLRSGNDCSDSLFSGRLVPWNLMTPQLRSRLQRGPWTADNEEADEAEAAALDALYELRQQPGVLEIAEKTSPAELASRRIRAVLCQYSFA